MSQQEVAQVVDGKVRLKAVLGQRVVNEHDSSWMGVIKFQLLKVFVAGTLLKFTIVDEEVNRDPLGDDLLSKAPDRVH